MGSNPTSRTIHFSHAASRETRIGPPRGARKISLVVLKALFRYAVFEVLFSGVCFESAISDAFPRYRFQEPDTLVSIESEMELALRVARINCFSHFSNGNGFDNRKWYH